MTSSPENLNPQPPSGAEDTTSPIPPRPRRRRRLLRWLFLFIAALFLFAAGLHFYNNVSLTGAAGFQEKLDAALQRGLTWTENQESFIFEQNNIALYYMLHDMAALHPDPLLTDMDRKILALPMRPSCWKRMLIPDLPVSSLDLNDTIRQEIIDNKWILYALAPDKARLAPKDLEELFRPDLWQQRQLTHQLWALVHLKRATPTDSRLNPLIDHLTDRLQRELAWNRAVTDIYIQRIVFTLFAGHPEKINRRWIERVIENQASDGGWNDRWLLFFQSRRRPAFDFTDPPSDPHASIQALWLLYQVKYRYPDLFGLKK